MLSQCSTVVRELVLRLRERFSYIFIHFRLARVLHATDKTKYNVMSRDQTAGRSHSMKIDNSSFERVEEFKYSGAILTHQNSIHDEIKSRLKSGNACYHSVQNLLCSRLLSKNLKIKIYRNIILPVVVHG
jgi:hypothetical protein